MIQLVSVEKNLNGRGASLFHLGPVSLHVKSGDFVILRGPSGSGKSTLLSVIGCAVGVDHGSYRLDGKSLLGLTERQLADIRLRTFGYVYQAFHLVPYMTVRENVEVPLGYAGIARCLRRERTRELLDSLGLIHKIDSLPGELSGGQQQRVALARALANSPRAILADEPTGNLDTATADEVMVLLKRIHEQGTTMIIATHDERVAAFGNRWISVTDGTVVEEPFSPPKRAGE